MAMYMENRILVFLVLIFMGCNDKDIERCDLANTPMGNYINFKGFNRKIDKIIIKDLSFVNKSISYDNPNLEDNGDGELSLKINTNTIPLVQKGCIIIINDSLKYKISGVKVGKVQKSTMWNKKIFCELKEYKLNDSIISDNGYIIIYNRP